MCRAGTYPTHDVAQVSLLLTSHHITSLQVSLLLNTVAALFVLEIDDMLLKILKTTWVQPLLTRPLRVDARYLSFTEVPLSVAAHLCQRLNSTHLNTTFVCSSSQLNIRMPAAQLNSTYVCLQQCACRDACALASSHLGCA